VIIDDGMRRMLEKQDDVFYYVTVTNENEAQPSMPANAQKGILRGMHRVLPAAGGATHQNSTTPAASLAEPLAVPAVRLLAAGPILKEALAAAVILKTEFAIEAEVWSVTSFSELARDGIACERAQRLQGDTSVSWVAECLGTNTAPVLAVSDYVRAVPESIRAFVPGRFATLGTDGFGRSDTRAALRDFFEVDAKWIAFNALAESFQGKAPKDRLDDAAKRLGLDLHRPISSQ
jgi:pyruvate dehydrogenase E1 component